MSKIPLRVVAPGEEGLGLLTIMDRTLAAKHGVPYVHLSAFAIDVDRAREALDEAELDDGATSEAWPFGWEVFLTARYLEIHVRPGETSSRELLEDVCQSVFETASGAGGQVYGAQLPFAIYALVHRGTWPTELRALFSSWRHKPDRLVKDLSALFADEEATGRLAAGAMQVDLEPPLAPPTLEALRALGSR